MRQYIRHPFSIPIKYRADSDGNTRKEDLSNISHGGLCFKSQTTIQVGSEIILNIAVKDPPFEAHATVVWCKEMPDYFEVGVQFDTPTTEFALRMVEQVCYIQQYQHDVKEYEGRSLTSEAAAKEWIKKFANEFPT